MSNNPISPWSFSPIVVADGNEASADNDVNQTHLEEIAIFEERKHFSNFNFSNFVSVQITFFGSQRRSLSLDHFKVEKKMKWNAKKQKKKKIETATTAATDCTAGELIAWRKGSALTLSTYFVCCHLDNVGFGFVKEWFVWKPGNKTYRIDEKECFLINLVTDCILFKTAL